jgi:hypothetical protein
VIAVALVDMLPKVFAFYVRASLMLFAAVGFLPSLRYMATHAAHRRKHVECEPELELFRLGREQPEPNR